MAKPMTGDTGDKACVATLSVLLMKSRKRAQPCLVGCRQFFVDSKTFVIGSPNLFLNFAWMHRTARD